MIDPAATNHRMFVCALVVAACAGWGSVQAQKLADAPSSVMLSKNIQQQNDDTGAVGGAPVVGTVATDNNLRAASKQPALGKRVTSLPSQLTIQQAEQIAIQNNPHISVSRLLARAQHQVYRETRSAYLPHVNFGAVGEQADSGSRYTFDNLRSTRLLTHFGGGLDMNQLIFDFGHTSNLIASSKLQEKAQNAHALASQLDIVMMTDQAFFDALEAQAMVKVAQQTVNTRQATDEQIAELTKYKLRSDIDQAFSTENVARAKLMLLDAQDQYQKSLNALTSLLGFDRPMQYALASDDRDLPVPPPDQDVLVQVALKQRPDLIELDYNQKAARKYSRAEWDQLLPSLNTLGVVGLTPIRTDRYFTSNWFGAVGLNLRVNLFNGFLYTSQAHAADARAKADQESLRDLRDNVVKGVRDAWLQSNTSYQKIAVTEKLLQASNLALKLAQARYKLGLSSIVELSDTQLEQTRAAIENVNARIEYQLSLAALNYQLGNLP
ncbi:MAG TPA: TolC family protein [Acidobacteriaceae bacterium]|nr:TolC family protein [Acidobacteriaceae bacterium]